MPRLVPIEGDQYEQFGRIARARAQGEVPLALDPRWAPELRESVLRSLDAWNREGAVPSDAAWATTTSGSSARPRILVRSASSWAAAYPAVAGLLGADDHAAVLLPAPLAASITLFSVAHALEGRGPRPVFGPEPGDATCFHGTPHALRRFLETGRTGRVTSALVGGSRLDPDLVAAAAARGIRVSSYYGAAELSFVALDRGDGLRAFPGVELNVRGGVIWAKTPQAALRYLGAAGPLETDGEFATVGDLGALEHGRLTVHGRSDGAILTASATVIPEEVEAWLRTQPGVRDAVVLGLRVPRVGALVAAVVEPTPHARPELMALRAAARRDLGPAHRPRAWFSLALPRTSAGKPARAEVSRLVSSGEAVRLV
jgi:long-chain acyl-CoA synthetase